VSELVYLYGFVPLSAPRPPAELAGVGGGRVGLVGVGPFAVACGQVPAGEYGAAAIEPRLSDLGWVAEQGIAHERVVAWFVDRSHILPAPLFTLYTSNAALLADAAARAEEIETKLDSFKDLREWDLKVAYDAEKLAGHAAELSEEVALLDARIAEAGPGQRFLLEKRRSELLRDRLHDVARTRAEHLLEELRRDAHDARTLPLPRSGRDLPVVLHAALLVAAPAELRLTEAVARRAAELQPLGLDIRYTGPWAPYRFVGSA